MAEGALYKFRNVETGQSTPEPIIRLLKSYWSSVAKVFPDAWGKSPRKSRLMHGAGIVSMGLIMDAITDRHSSHTPNITEFASDLRPLVDICRWTAGYWEFGPGQQRKWSEVQNTSKDVQMLSNYLLLQYKARVWDLALKRA